MPVSALWRKLAAGKDDEFNSKGKVRHAEEDRKIILVCMRQ